jgi:hypothetical protein
MHDTTNVEAGRGYGLVADGQPARSVLVPGEHQPAVRCPGRDPRNDLQPFRVALLEEGVSVTGRRIGLEKHPSPLVSSLDQQ